MGEGGEQKSAFLGGEADAYFARNQAKGTDRDLVDDLLAMYLNGTESVLEIGCAEGRRLWKLASATGVTDLVGIDPSAAAVTWGNANLPGLDLRRGTADDLPVDRSFGSVMLGFCLYLCDRALLPRIVAEVDSHLNDGGNLVIHDFDPPGPRRRDYAHRPGISSYKMDYSSLFTVFPQYSLAAKHPFNADGAPSWTPDEGERTALWILKKDLGVSYPSERS